MDGPETRWDSWSVEQWLEGARPVEKLAGRFEPRAQLNVSFRPLREIPRRPLANSTGADLEYFRSRAAQEQTAALQSCDKRVRKVHLDMAERYWTLIHSAEVCCAGEPSFVSR